jgi:hypothetical protein
MKTISVQLLLLVSFFICLAPFASAQDSPADVVKRFCTMRYDATEFTDSKEYSKLTVWGQDYDEPGWDKFFIVDTFSVAKTKLYGYVAFVDVIFKTYGVYEGDKWFPRDSSEVIQYILMNTKDGWKIYYTGDNPRISLAAFLKGSDKSLDDLYKVFQDNKSNKIVYDEYSLMYNDRKKSISDLKLLEAKRSQAKH